MACSFYDEFRSAEPAAYHLQRRIGADGACRAHCELFSMWKPCGSFGSHFSLAREIPKNIFQFQWVFGAGEPGCRSQLSYAISENLGRNVKATGGWFFIGIVLAALFQRYVPAEAMTAVFGGNKAFGVLMAATVGVPLYACGGGTIPLLQGWLLDGMSLGSAAAFMVTGPATKITNLGAVKIVLGVRRFVLYLAYVMAFSFIAGLAVNHILFF